VKAIRPTGAAVAADAPLIITKLIAPPLRTGFVPRPHLIARLDACRTSALTLVSAPAGYGKTTLLAAWLAEQQEAGGRRQEAGDTLTIRRSPCPLPPFSPEPQPFHTAWLTLDADDSDPVRFWRYVLAVLRRAVPGLPAGLDAPLRAAPPQLTQVVAALANAVAGVPGAIVLILDDYHLIDDLAVHRSLAALLEHCPPNLHLVLAGRADPPLPLACLQARGQLQTLRAADLRFSPAEAATFLHQTMQLILSTEVSAQLADTTEGWPAGLQLAALWLRDHPQAADNLAALNNADRYVVKFLADEVITRQPPEIRHFLATTAILDRMCPELCDYLLADARPAATGFVRPAQQLIDEIERRNLFIYALEPSGKWYAYHAFFRDVLRHELIRQFGQGTLTRLHRRAAAWFAAAAAEAPELLEEALRHAFRAQAHDLAADIITPHSDDLTAQGRISQLIAWLGGLPEPILSARPALALRYAWALFLHGRQEDAVRLLERAETTLAETAPPDPVTAALPDVIRAAMATTRHDDATILEHADRAAALLPPGELIWTPMIAIARGLAHLVRGEAHTAAVALQHAADLAEYAGNSYGVMVSNWHLGRTRIEQGRRDEAARVFQRIALVDDPLYSGYRDVGLALVAAERAEREAAHAYAERGLRAIEAVAGQPRVVILAHSLLAQIAHTNGAPADAAAALECAERLARRLGLSEDLAEVLALRAEFALQSGDPAGATEWALSAGLDAATPDVRREREWLAFARLLVAQGQTERALSIADGLHALAVRQGRTRSQNAWEALRNRAATDQGDGAVTASAGRAPGSSRIAGCYEALSERELRVLRLIAVGRSNQEIAGDLIVSVNTIKTHIKRIYEKLQVNSRIGAVERARELGMYH
jgi:LuxR family transcriptional regulator, maltose regulon positive regulatory protein